MTRHLQLDHSVWRLALADLQQRGRNHLIGGAYDGTLLAIDPEADAVAWRRDLGAFPFAVAAADVDGDGAPEVLAACADGTLHCLDAAGEPRWAWSARFPLYNVVVGAFVCDRAPLIAAGGIDHHVTILDGRGAVIASHPLRVVTHRLAAGDLDGDGLDELLALDNRETAIALKLDNGELAAMWETRLTVPEAMRNWENPRGSFFAFSLAIDDVDGDGRVEIIGGDTYFNKQAVLVADAGGEAKWIAGTREDAAETGWAEFYSTAFVRAAHVLPGRPEQQVLCVSGSLVRLFDHRGELIEAARAGVGFTDFVIDGRTLWLGSSPNGDRTLYRVDLDGDRVAQIEAIERQGFAAEIGRTIEQIGRRIRTLPATPPDRPEPYTIGELFGVRPRPQAVERTAERIASFQTRYPYDNLAPIAKMKVIEPQQPRRADGRVWNETRWATDSINGTMTVEQIIDAARAVEAAQVPTVFNIGHSCMPFVTLETAGRMLDAAPEYLLGFESAEDEHAPDVPDYMEQFIGPLATMCAARGKRVYVKNKNVWWMSMPADRRVFDALFAPDRRDAIVAATEDSNSRTPEINLMARFGLRQAGLIRRLSVGMIGDLFSFCRFHQWEYPGHGHPYLRLLVAHALLGGDSFNFRTGKWIGPRDWGFDRIGRESGELLLEMLGRGLVFTPGPDQMAGMSPLGIAVHPPPEDWLIDGHNGHRPHRYPDTDALEQAVIPRNGSTWGMSPTPGHALQAVLFRKRRQFGYHVPPTPFGPVAIVPAQADLDRVEGVRKWWHTDGVDLWAEPEGERLRGARAAEALRRSFEAAARELPFRAIGDDVFFHSVRLSDDAYRLYAIDPGWLDPADRHVQVRPQLPGSWRLIDALDGSSLTADGDGEAVPLTVPAGALRIIDATRG